VAGTGANCIGRGPDGRRVQIGGMGRVSGDAGFAADLALRAAAAAWRAHDGRGPRSVLPAMVSARLGLERLEALADRCPHDRFGDADQRALIASLFDAVAAGDPAGVDVIEAVAEQMAAAARTALAQLALDGADATVVLGGAMLQLPEHLPLADAIRARLGGVRSVILAVPPVTGALLWAADLARVPAAGLAGVGQKIAAQLAQIEAG
jgi:N-acetylglucosamine kinase-like BadF-type ATPase